MKTVSLRGTAGELTLSGTFNTFDLDGAERKLVYDIIDLMKKYEAEKDQKLQGLYLGGRASVPKVRILPDPPVY